MSALPFLLDDLKVKFSWILRESMASSKLIASRSPNCSMDDIIGSYFSGVAYRSLGTIMIQRSSLPNST